MKDLLSAKEMFDNIKKEEWYNRGWLWHQYFNQYFRVNDNGVRYCKDKAEWDKFEYLYSSSFTPIGKERIK